MTALARAFRRGEDSAACKSDGKPKPNRPPSFRRLRREMDDAMGSSSYRPVFDLQARYPLEVAQVAGDDGGVVLEGDGGDADVGRTNPQFQSAQTFCPGDSGLCKRKNLPPTKESHCSAESSVGMSKFL